MLKSVCFVLKDCIYRLSCQFTDPLYDARTILCCESKDIKGRGAQDKLFKWACVGCGVDIRKWNNSGPGKICFTSPSLNIRCKLQGHCKINKSYPILYTIHMLATYLIYPAKLFSCYWCAFWIRIKILYLTTIKTTKKHYSICRYCTYSV